MRKKTYKCKNCGHVFSIEVFESQEEAQEFVRRNPNKRPVPVICEKCGSVQ